METRFKLCALVVFTLTTIIIKAQPYSVSMVYDIHPGSGDPYGSGSYPNNLTVFDNKLIFYADDGLHGSEVWAYNGVNTPYLVEDINVGIGGCSDADNSRLFVKCNNKLYFRAYRATIGKELWEYDGNNTQEFDLLPGPDGSGALPQCSYNGVLYFWGYIDSVLSGQLSYEESQIPAFTKVNYDFGGAEYNNRFYSIRYSNVTENSELVSYSGFIHNQPTIEIDSLPYYCFGISKYFVLNNKLIFSCPYGTDYTLWEFDADSSNVEEVGNGLKCGESMCMFNNKLYFSANDGLNGYELWKYDGVNPPSMVKNISETGSSSPNNLTVVSNKLFFLADSGSTYIWVYDGITSPKKAISCSGYFGIEPNNLTAYNNKLYLTKYVYNCGSELCVLNDLSGIDNPSWLNANIYPNPVKDELNLELPSGTSEDHLIEISNIMGQIVYTSKMSTNSIKISTSIWQTGVYVLTMYNNKETVLTSKFIKE